MINRTFAFLLGLTLSTHVYALMLGPVIVKSRIGEPFQASIQITTETNEFFFPDCIRIMPTRPVDGLTSINDLRMGFESKPGSNNQATLLLWGVSNVNEPIARFSLKVGCQNGKVQEQTVFIDPAPVMSSEAQIDSPSVTTTYTEDVKSPQRVVRGNNLSIKKAASASAKAQSDQAVENKLITTPSTHAENLSNSKLHKTKNPQPLVKADFPVKLEKNTGRLQTNKNQTERTPQDQADRLQLEAVASTVVKSSPTNTYPSYPKGIFKGKLSKQASAFIEEQSRQISRLEEEKASQQQTIDQLKLQLSDSKVEADKYQKKVNDEITSLRKQLEQEALIRARDQQKTMWVWTAIGALFILILIVTVITTLKWWRLVRIEHANKTSEHIHRTEPG